MLPVSWRVFCAMANADFCAPIACKKMDNFYGVVNLNKISREFRHLDSLIFVQNALHFVYLYKNNNLKTIS